MSPSTVPVSTIGESTYNNNNETNGNGIDAISPTIRKDENKGKNFFLSSSEGDEVGGGNFGKKEEEEEEEDEIMITNGITSSIAPTQAIPPSQPPTMITTLHQPHHQQHSYHHQHGIYKSRRQARSKSPVLKRVSFGSSKGSMVETLIYDHNDDDLLKDKFNSNGGNQNNNSSSERYLNGNHISNYSQPIHFHYPINRRLGSRVASDSTISSSLIIDRPSRVRVSLYESGRPASIVSPETPEPLSTFNSINNNNNHNNNNINCCTTISRIINPPLSSSVTSNYTNHHHQQQQQSISHSTLSSTTVNHPHHNQDHHQLTLDLVKMMERKISVDSGFENPFRPGGELSREAETIVNLIKEGKPITPTTPTKELTSGDSSSSSPSSKILNGISSNNQSPNEQLSPSNSDKLPKITNSGSTTTTTTINKLNEMKQSTKTNGDSSKIYPESNDAKLSSNKLNGSSKPMLNHKTSNGSGGPNSPGQNERSIVTPSEQLKDENKKNKKCICCVVQ